VLPRSGWDIFREEQNLIVKSEGYTGKEISSEIGRRWRKLSSSVKEKYNSKAKMRASFLKVINSDSNILERACTLKLHDKVAASAGDRRKSI